MTDFTPTPEERTHCKNGHAFTPENTYQRASGGRRCRICQREAEKRHRSALAALAGEDAHETTHETKDV